MNKNTPKTLQAVADAIGARLEGDPNCFVLGLATLEKAKNGEISFLSNRQYRKYLSSTEASAVILGVADEKDCKVNALVCKNPRLALAKAVQLFEKKSTLSLGVHSSVVVGEGCQIPDSVSIGPHSVLGDRVILEENVVVGSGCSIGDDCQLGRSTELKARCTLYHAIKIGQECLIHSGVVIGSDGFGFANDNGAWLKIPHLGGVSIGDSVDIGANTTIDRGFLEDTIIGDGVIIDNLVQIGHNVSIGKHTAIAGCVGIAGSTKIGEFCLIGGGASIAGHITITDKVCVTAISGVNHSLNSPGVYSSGFPAKPAQSWRKNAARFQYLDTMYKRLRALENKMSQSEFKVEECENED